MADVAMLELRHHGTRGSGRPHDEGPGTAITGSLDLHQPWPPLLEIAVVQMHPCAGAAGYGRKRMPHRGEIRFRQMLAERTSQGLKERLNGPLVARLDPV